MEINPIRWVENRREAQARKVGAALAEAVDLDLKSKDSTLKTPIQSNRETRSLSSRISISMELGTERVKKSVVEHKGFIKGAVVGFVIGAVIVPTCNDSGQDYSFPFNTATPLSQPVGPNPLPESTPPMIKTPQNLR